MFLFVILSLIQAFMIYILAKERDYFHDKYDEERIFSKTLGCRFISKSCDYSLEMAKNLELTKRIETYENDISNVKTKVEALIAKIRSEFSDQSKYYEELLEESNAFWGGHND